jgi:chitin-binding protein
MKGRLPRGKSGRHIIFTIWRNTSTPDTYYSCSDVVFGGRSGEAGRGAGGGDAGGGDAGKRESPAPTPTPRGTESAAAGAGRDGGANDVNAVPRSSHSLVPLVTGGGAMAVVLAGGAAFLVLRRGRRRATTDRGQDGR